MSRVNFAIWNRPINVDGLVEKDDEVPVGDLRKRDQFLVVGLVVGNKFGTNIQIMTDETVGWVFVGGKSNYLDDVVDDFFPELTEEFALSLLADEQEEKTL